MKYKFILFLSPWLLKSPVKGIGLSGLPSSAQHCGLAARC